MSVAPSSTVRIKKATRRRAIAVALVVMPLKLHSTWLVKVSASGRFARVVRM